MLKNQIEECINLTDRIMSEHYRASHAILIPISRTNVQEIKEKLQLKEQSYE